jgi:anthranilate 1,2-dioxygenase reductase subunit
MSDKHTITCLFEDGSSVGVQASPIESVYQACLRHGLTLQTDCREGACAVCKGRLLSGEGRIGDVSREALTEEEEAEGFLLSCQFRVKSNCVIEFPYSLSLIKGAVSSVTATIVAVTEVARNVARLLVRTTGKAPAFLPGQYANLTVPGKVPARSYSYANRPEDSQALEFFIRLLPQGQMSDYLRSAQCVGETIELTGPYGHFFLRPPRSRRLIMVAGGTGLAPMLSILDTLEASTDASNRPQVSLLYGANEPAELFAQERLAAKRDWVTCATIVVAGDAQWSGPTGFVTKLIDPALTAGDPDAYLCGPPPMIESARQALVDLGVPAKRIFAEKFSPSGRS